MNPALEKLTKYLKLEAEKGFENSAVVGGLEKASAPWKEEAEKAGLPQPIVDLVSSRFRDYPRLTRASREVALRGLWNRLEAEFADLSEAEDPFAQTKPEGKDTPGEPDEVSPSSPGDEPLERAPAEHKGADPAAVDSRPELPQDGSAAFEAPLTTIAGIGPKSAKTLAKLNLQTLGDLLWHLPRRYDDYSELKTINRLWYGEEVTIIGTVDQIGVRAVRSGKMKLVEATISDGSGSMRVTWFNQPWVAKSLSTGKAVVLSGRVDQYLGRLTMNNPEWEPLNRQQLHTNRIVPVYPLTAGVTQKWLRRVMNSVVTRLAPRVADPLPESVRASTGLLSLPEALSQVHFPDSWETLKASQKRLAFDEMLLLQLGVLRQKRDWERVETDPLTVDDGWLDRFVSALPFRLTDTQQRILEDLRIDLAGAKPMNRLLQGDVGSGKTVLAAAAIGITAANDAQSVIMAPTSILAEQHYQTLLEILPSAAGVDADAIRLLLGATPESDKQEIRDRLETGEIKVLIGTHAVLEDPILFDSLALTVIDEQHRFGVEQRAVLRAKGRNPNLLVMTATPIPRSLALTIYGDLDLAVLDEMPPGRQPVETRVLQPVERSRAYSFIQGQLDKGRQAFIIYPLVESSEKTEAPSAVEEHARLQSEVFPSYRIGLLHGRLRAEEKEEVMQTFRERGYHILVSTSVVEVGVDVPNASVMLIEGANRFGLSQLHQFRGRVGRGPHASYCLLIPEGMEELENERLKAMETTNDGFKLAELDLEQRGPGDFFGTRQSGFTELKLASLTNLKLIERARGEAQKIFESDPELALEENYALSEAVGRFWQPGRGEIS